MTTFMQRIAIISVLSLGVLSGCATITKGSTQKIPIASDPSDADITADGQALGQTPIDITLARKRDHLVTVAKKGYHPKSIAITKSTGGAVWGNILVGGLIGWGIDASTGAQYNLNPESISVRLEPLGEGESGAESGAAKSDFVRKLNDLDVLKEDGSISEEEYASMRTGLFKEYYPQMDLEVTKPPPDTATPVSDKSASMEEAS